MVQMSFVDVNMIVEEVSLVTNKVSSPGSNLCVSLYTLNSWQDCHMWVFQHGPTFEIALWRPLQDIINRLVLGPLN